MDNIDISFHIIRVITTHYGAAKAYRPCRKHAVGGTLCAPYIMSDVVTAYQSN